MRIRIPEPAFYLFIWIQGANAMRIPTDPDPSKKKVELLFENIWNLK